jgi:hypothetical protein
MTQVTATAATIEFLKKQERFSTLFSEKNGEQTEIFATLEEAKKHYDSIDVMDFSSADKSFWYNNKEGYEAELRELKELPISLITELNECETEEEMMEAYMYDDVHHTYADRIETKYSYLSDEWDETLGKDGEFVIKENKVAGITYGTHFGKIEMVKISELISQ